jgi:hypothetical protein
MRREPEFTKRSPRVDTRIDALLIDANGNEIEVVVCDISRDGCRLESVAALDTGETVRIRVPRYGDFPAQIRWALDNEAGAIFLEPVEFEEGPDLT